MVAVVVVIDAVVILGELEFDVHNTVVVVVVGLVVVVSEMVVGIVVVVD